MKHLHHNPPQHRVGKHDNTIEVTINQHIMFHFCEWQLHGLREDYIAYRGLAGMMKDEEILEEKLKLGGRNGGVRCRDNGTGIHGLTFDERSRNGKVNGVKGGKIGGKSRSERKINACRINYKKAMVASIEWTLNHPEEARQKGVKGNKAQRAKLSSQGKTIAEKSWLITFDDGRVENVTNLAKWCVENDYTKCHLSAVSRGKRNRHKDIISVKKL